MAKKFLGILGGMGSEAGAYLLQRILHHTPARTDREHLEILLHSNPRTPDRTKAILGLGPSSEPELIRSVKLLEKAGVECIVIACVTSHFYIESLRSSVRPIILSIVEETAEYLTEIMPDRKNVGLLATTGTIRAGFFQKAFDRRSCETLILPDKEQKSLIMEAVYGEKGIKAGFLDNRNRTKLLEASTKLIEQGAEVLVAGCTEIPLVLKEPVEEVPIVDTLEVLALKAVSFCRDSI